jgi:hypothetical protein
MQGQNFLPTKQALNYIYKTLLFSSSENRNAAKSRRKKLPYNSTPGTDAQICCCSAVDHFFYCKTLYTRLSKQFQLGNATSSQLTLGKKIDITLT